MMMTTNNKQINPLKATIKQADGTIIEWDPAPSFPELEKWMVKVSALPLWLDTQVVMGVRVYRIHKGFWQIEGGVDMLVLAVKNKAASEGISLHALAKESKLNYVTVRKFLTYDSHPYEPVVQILEALGVTSIHFK